MPHRSTTALAFSLALIGAAALMAPACQRVVQRQDSARANQFRVRAEQGDPDAQYRLGSAYYYGRGVPQDYAESIRWFRISAGQGVAKAQYALGYGYTYGHGVSLDYAEAARWYRKAADQGYARAQCALARSYYAGTGVSQNLTESIRWYRRCADQGDVTGQRTLAYLFVRGEGAPRDLAEAARWFRRAADQGDRIAQAYLASAYRTGLGVPRDNVAAARWYLKLAWSSARRLGWTPVAVLVVCVSFLVVPERRWGRARWLSWGLLSAACAAFAIHLVSDPAHSGWGHTLDVGGAGALSALCAFAAVYAAVHDRKPPEAAGSPNVAPTGGAA